MKRTALLVAIGTVLVGTLFGCGSGSTVTKEEEEAFRNPPKGGMPEDVRKKMEESRAKGEAIAAEARRKTEERNRAAATTGG